MYSFTTRMSFDWGEYLRLAKELVNKTGEAELRSAISRAYYSIFRRACKFLKSKNIPITESGKDHQLVPILLKNRPDLPREAHQLGIHLERLRDDRRRADYDDVFPNLEKQARLDMLIAEDCHKILIEILLNK